MSEARKALNRKDGYIMGSKGQDPKKLNSWYFNQYNPDHKDAGSSASTTTYKKALHWKENAERVWDCNGLAEGIYQDYSGINIDTDTDGKARYNYARWCDPKGTGMIPVEKRVEGAAVFWGNSASKITHVAYLDEPVEAGKPEGDWWIIEARGVTYGVVRTKLLTREPNFWGWMTKYFNYDNAAVPEVKEYKLGERTLQKGDKGNDVKELQTLLTSLGYSLEIDGDFGSNTKSKLSAFQKDNGLSATGVLDEKTYKKLLEPKATEGGYKVTGSSVYLWDNHPSYGGKKSIIVKKNDILGEPEFEDYVPIIHNGTLKWINKKYIEART